jgi:DNA-binding response OmpR family regulator
MPKKILVVDDDLDSLRLAESILKPKGYEVLTLGQSRLVFKLVKSDKPDLIISDIIMPQLDGYALCDEMRKLYSGKIPIILCTSKPYERELIDKAYKDFGAQDFLMKPFKAEELLQKIQAIIGQPDKAETVEPETL